MHVNICSRKAEVDVIFYLLNYYDHLDTGECDDAIRTAMCS